MTLPAAKVAIAHRSIGLRPKMSDSLPQIGVDAALASKYDDPIQVYPAEEWNAEVIVGRAVVAMVKSKAARKRHSYSQA